VIGTTSEPTSLDPIRLVRFGEREVLQLLRRELLQFDPTWRRDCTVRLSWLRRVTGHAALVRVMPNLPATLGLGFSALSYSRQVGPSGKRIAKALFEAVGDVVELPERHLDAVTAVSGSGPEAGESRNRNGFAAKFAFSQELVWARGFGGPGNDEVSAIAMTPVGSAVIVGDFHDTARFIDARLTAQDASSDAFVLELSGSTGRHQSSVGFGGRGEDRALGVSSDARGDFHVTGLFREETFALGELVVAPSADGETDIFVLRIR